MKEVVLLLNGMRIISNNINQIARKANETNNIHAKDIEILKMVYEMYSGHSFDEPKPEQGNGRVKAIHYIQSFSPDDDISPEVAHKIAKAFVIKTFGKEVQAVIATHLNTKCVHNHIIINSYSISGQNFYANKDSLKRARKYSDAVSRAFGIEPSQSFKGGGRYISNAEYQHIKRGTS